MIEILSKHKVDVMKNSFKILMCMGILMNTYASNIDVQIQYIDARDLDNNSIKYVKITDEFGVMCSKRHLNDSDLLNHDEIKDWVLRIYPNSLIEFLKSDDQAMQKLNFPSDIEIKELVGPVLSYLIGNNKNMINYLNNKPNRDAVLNFFCNIPSDAEQKTAQAMLRLKEKIQYDPTSSLFQTLTFLGSVRLFIGDTLISNTITSMFVWIFPFLTTWQLFVFVFGVVAQRHPLYFFDPNNVDKIVFVMSKCIQIVLMIPVIPIIFLKYWINFPSFEEVYLVPKWGGWFPNLFYWLISKPKEVDLQPFNTYLPLISLYNAADCDKNKLNNVEKCLLQFKPGFTLQDMADALKADLKNSLFTIRDINIHEPLTDSSTPKRGSSHSPHGMSSGGSDDSDEIGSDNRIVVVAQSSGGIFVDVG